MAIRNLALQIKEGDPTVERRLRAIGYDFDQYGMPKPDVAGIHIATPVFDGARENDVFDTIRASGMDQPPRLSSMMDVPVSHLRIK